jgi:hypothetical protein
MSDSKPVERTQDERTERELEDLPVETLDAAHGEQVRGGEHCAVNYSKIKVEFDEPTKR